MSLIWDLADTALQQTAQALYMHLPTEAPPASASLSCSSGAHQKGAQNRQGKGHI